MKTFTKSALFLLWLLIPASIFAQSSVSGTVTDATTGQPIPGVNVIVSNTSNGASTDFDGRYTLNNVEEGSILSFSYVGYIAQQISFNGQAQIDIALQEDAAELEQVVLIGYGAARKKDLTGSVSKVTAKDLNQGTLTDPIQALQGKAAGVTITKQGGDPNAGFNVRIRGASGFAAAGDPLYVVDGIRGVDPTTIAPEDIVSYDVLKDGASTAIYGADGANGVIFITTKSGKAGKLTIGYNSYIAIDEVARELKLQSAEEYRAYINNNLDRFSSFADAGGNVDWQDEIYTTGITINNNFSLAGGSEKTTYRASVSHTDFEGVIEGSDKKRTIARFNLTQKAFNDKVKFIAGISNTIENNDFVNYGGNGGTDVLFQSFQRLPTDPILNADGTYFETARIFNYFNPVASLNQIQNERDAKRFAANIGAEIQLLEGLTGKFDYSYLRNDDESTYFEPRYSNVLGGQNTLIRRGFGRRAYNNWQQNMVEMTLTYDKSFGDHNFTALLGHSYRVQNWDGFSVEGRDPISNILGSDNFQNFETLQLGDAQSYKDGRKDAGFFSRVKYNYASKYYITGMVRRDGSSVFGENNRWGWFPSVQVAWNIANESFLRDNIEEINNLKLRASWGLSGNSNIPTNRALLRVGPSGTSIDPNTQDPIINLDYFNNPNPDLQWDQNQEINVGLDFGLFNNRISGTVDYYNKKLTDLLAIYDVPRETNFAPRIFANGGEIKNSGVEVTLLGKVIQNHNFTWNTTATFSKNTQEIVSLDGGLYDLEFRDVGFISAPGIVGVSTQRMLPNEKIGTFYGFEYAGVSDGKWLIRGNDGELHFLDDVSQSDEHKKVLGNALPDFELGWSNNFTYKNWDLSMAFRAVVGHDIYNATRQVFGNPDYITQRNVLSEAFELDGRVGGAYQTLSYYIEDGSFLRLDNVNLGYTLPENTIPGVSKLRVYASVNNVFTLTNYSGIDPEVNFSGGNRDNGEIFFGIDQYNIYPKTRTITLGLNVEL